MPPPSTQPVDADPDVAAAFPSLHAAYPLLAALALWPGGAPRRVGCRFAAALPSGAVWFSVVYLGSSTSDRRARRIVFAAGTWLIMTKILVPRVPSLQRRSQLRDLLPARRTPAARTSAVPAAQEETAAPQGSG